WIAALASRRPAWWRGAAAATLAVLGSGLLALGVYASTRGLQVLQDLQWSFYANKFSNPQLEKPWWTRPEMAAMALTVPLLAAAWAPPGPPLARGAPGLAGPALARAAPPGPGAGLAGGAPATGVRAGPDLRRPAAGHGSPGGGRAE